MIPLLVWLLRFAGAGLALLSILHIPIGRRLKWREDAARLTPVNRSVFHVHTLFICLLLLLMAAPCLFDPRVFLEPSRGGAWMSGSFAVFWACRLIAQWCIYPADLWRGKRMETAVHWWFTAIWTALTALFAACSLIQARMTGSFRPEI